eukprot:SAG31_NODE_4528_length_3162_cov_5.936990_1_plen_570_part_00
MQAATCVAKAMQSETAAKVRESGSAYDQQSLALSVLLPIYNAMPWLPITVRDMLKQQLAAGTYLELICTFDGGDDGSLQFLADLVSILGPNRATIEICAPPAPAPRRSIAAQAAAAADGSSSSPSPPAKRAKGLSGTVDLRQMKDMVAETGDCAPLSVSNHADQSLNPAMLQKLRAAEDEDHPSFKPEHVPTDGRHVALSAAEVAEVAQKQGHVMRVLKYSDGRNRGQGAAMSLALSRARAPLIAQMESDDERSPTDAFAKMLNKLAEEPSWDGVSCGVELVGWNRPGMQGYVEWQNGLLSPSQMAAGRFVEIPALHQTCIFRRSAIDSVLASTAGTYRDGPWYRTRHGHQSVASDPEDTKASDPEDTKLYATAEEAHADTLDTPVDYWWWLAFFHAGKKCGKLGVHEAGGPLLGWRQHPRQHTRTHGRLAIEQLRKIKVHFLLRQGGPIDKHNVTRLVVASRGATLEGWVADLRAHPRAQAGSTRGLQILAVDWKPGRKGPSPLPQVARLSGPPHHCVSTSGLLAEKEGDKITSGCTMRLWAFGKARVQQKVREQVADWADETDLFVA